MCPTDGALIFNHRVGAQITKEANMAKTIAELKDEKKAKLAELKEKNAAKVTKLTESYDAKIAKAQEKKAKK